MFSKAKLFWLGEFADNLCKRVMELELQVKPSTPPEVLKKRRKLATKSVKRIEEAEALCAKEVEQVSQSYEDLIDDEELEKVKEQIHTTKEEVI